MKKIKCLILILSLSAINPVFAFAMGYPEGGYPEEPTHTHHVREALKEIFLKFHHHHFHIFPTSDNCCRLTRGAHTFL